MTAPARTLRNRQQTVVERLREMIMTGVLKGDQRLLEVSLSEQLGVSRTPVREALIVLAEDGLVDYRLNRGYVVRAFSIDYVLNAYVVREALESLACRLAAERPLDPELKRRMEAALARGDDILAGRRLSAALRDPWREVNDELHRLLLAAAANPPLEQALAAATRIPYSGSRVVHWFEDEDLEGLYQLRMVHRQHHAIVEAIAAGESYRAETLMRGHIAYAADHVHKQFAAAKAGIAEAA
ncbi:GntR family transcriptional regulator [Sphingomonas profundi]|uniref:GntR family transcriptional regulator n=1 Tax=Alterirhizorhabdus profundi TaxID=2681549 RepID=UPI0012E96AE5|nr:GntR family transcriptional regulator [Sphingomonas profundi]